MSSRPFEKLTRRAALLVMRTPGMAGIAASADPLTANAKNKKSNTTKKAKQKCKSQVGQCLEVFKTLTECPDPADCLATGERCCPFLASCDITGFFRCETTPA